MPELSTDSRTFYAQQGPITDPREHRDLHADLPADVRGLARTVTVGGVRLPELGAMTIAQVHRWVGELEKALTGEQRAIGGEGRGTRASVRMESARDRSGVESSRHSLWGRRRRP